MYLCSYVEKKNSRNPCHPCLIFLLSIAKKHGLTRIPLNNSSCAFVDSENSDGKKDDTSSLR